MQIKRSFGLIFSLVLAISLVWFGFKPVSSLATPAMGPTSHETQFLSAEANRVAHAESAESAEFVVPPLPYAYDALEPYIDSETMMLHHDKHHAGYVRNLNGAIAKHPELKYESAEALLRDLDNLPDDIRSTVRNSGGGHANHTLFWEIMTPEGQGQPTGRLATAINETFGDFATFKQEFNTAGKRRFGSGWAWLVLTQDGTLEVTSTANQDSPFLAGNYPLMGNDVWEHAYYLNYQNRRGDYLDAWWNIVNWDKVNQRFESAQAALGS
ncbi:MAG: superoxide dismutase [Cyanobacteria bacterium P01_G01_bin.54]